MHRKRLPAIVFPLAVAIGLGSFLPPMNTVVAAAEPPIVSDNFSRTVSTGFGAAPVGGSYTHPVVSGLRVDGSQGRMTIAATATRSALLRSPSAVDVDVSTTFGLSALPNAGSVYLGQMLRTSSRSQYYAPRLRIMPDRKVHLGLRSVDASGASTSVGDDLTLAVTMSATTKLKMRTQVQASTIRIKVWAATSAEPTAWNITRTFGGTLSAPSSNASVPES